VELELTGDEGDYERDEDGVGKEKSKGEGCFGVFEQGDSSS